MDYATDNMPWLSLPAGGMPATMTQVEGIARLVRSALGTDVVGTYLHGSGVLGRPRLQRTSTCSSYRGGPRWLRNGKRSSTEC